MNQSWWRPIARNSAPQHRRVDNGNSNDSTSRDGDYTVAGNAPTPLPSVAPLPAIRPTGQSEESTAPRENDALQNGNLPTPLPSAPGSTSSVNDNEEGIDLPSMQQLMTRDPELRRAVNYHGIRTVDQQNAMWDLPDHMNTSLWITGLPADCTHHDLLEQVRDVAKVFFLNINPPVLPRPGDTNQLPKPNSAATLIFFTPEGARCFLQKCILSPLTVKGCRAFVRPNLNKTPPHYNYAVSRVIIIEGPREYVNVEWIAEFLRDVGNMYWHTDTITVTELGDDNRLEWRFSGWKNQAETAYRTIAENLGQWMKVTYGRDPCGTV